MVPSKHYHDGIKALSDKRFNEAIILLERALDEDRRYRNIVFDEVVVGLRNAREQEAAFEVQLKEKRSALFMTPADLKIRRSLGDFLAINNRCATAVALMLEGITRDIQREDAFQAFDDFLQAEHLDGWDSETIDFLDRRFEESLGSELDQVKLTQLRGASAFYLMLSLKRGAPKGQRPNYDVRNRRRERAVSLQRLVVRSTPNLASTGRLIRYLWSHIKQEAFGKELHEYIRAVSQNPMGDHHGEALSQYHIITELNNPHLLLEMSKLYKMISQIAPNIVGAHFAARLLGHFATTYTSGNVRPLGDSTYMAEEVSIESEAPESNVITPEDLVFERWLAAYQQSREEYRRRCEQAHIDFMKNNPSRVSTDYSPRTLTEREAWDRVVNAKEKDLGEARAYYDDNYGNDMS